MLMKKPFLTRQMGLVCLTLSLLIGYFGPRTHLVAENWLDGIRGVFLGLAIGLLLLSLRSRARP